MSKTKHEELKFCLSTTFAQRTSCMRYGFCRRVDHKVRTTTSENYNKKKHGLQLIREKENAYLVTNFVALRFYFRFELASS
jgi:hypothetical protein